MSLDLLLSDTLVQAIGWTLLHFVWQAPAVAALLAVARFAVRDNRLRYVFGCAAMLTMVAGATVTFMLQVPAEVIVEAGATPAGTPVDRATTSAVAVSAPVVVERPMFYAIDTYDPGFVATFTGALRAHLAEIVTVWAIGVLLLSLRLVGGCWACYRIKRVGIGLLPEAMRSRVGELVARMDIRRHVRVVTSSIASVPMVVGIVRPVVLLPISAVLGLTPTQLEAILIHELAHVRRWDNLVNLLQRVVETLFFFHPAVWWVSNGVRTEREHGCDDVAAGRSDRKVYALALATLEETRHPRLAVAASDGPLLSRIRRLVSVDNAGVRDQMTSPPQLGLATLAAVIILAFAASEGTRAHEDHPEPEEDGTMNIAVDVRPDDRGKTLAACLAPLMRTAGRPEWSVDRLFGVMGHAFHFEMKQGGGSVMHDNLDWSTALDFIPQVGQFRSYKATKQDRDVDLAALKREAREAARASLANGIPALVWQPMSREMKEAREFAYCWGLIVGYNEEDETYSVRHPFREKTFTVRYDAIGHTDPAELFDVRVFEGYADTDEKAMHLAALRNAVGFATETRYAEDDERNAGRRRAPHGFSAYALWQQAFDSPDPPLDANRIHAHMLLSRRRAAVAYLGELRQKFFPEAAAPLQVAAMAYGRELDVINPLYQLVLSADRRGSITDEERTEARRLIGAALKEEHTAVANIETALRILESTSAERVKTVRPVSPVLSQKDAEAKMAIAVNVRPAGPNAESSLASSLSPLLTAAGHPQWTFARLLGVMGHAFQFDMKEGGVWVLHDALDWGMGAKIAERIARFRVFSASNKDKDVDRRVLMLEAREAIRASLARGIPAMAWSPMSMEMKAGPTPHPVCWGIIIGYNEAEETYTVRHPWVGKATYTVRYDVMGGIPQENESIWIWIYEGPGEVEEKSLHVAALRNAVGFAHGTRWKSAAARARPSGFTSYEVWRASFDSEIIPLNAAHHHAHTLLNRRPLAAAYLREMTRVFPEAGEALEAAAQAYDRETPILEALDKLLDEANERDAITSEERAEAQRFIDEALKVEREAVAGVEAALKVLDAS